MDSPPLDPAKRKRVAVGLLVSGAVGLVGVALWFLLGGGAPAAGGQRPPYVLPVTLVEVSQRDLTPRARLTGSVRSTRRVRVAFTVAGVVSSLEVGEGDRVRRGRVLASVDSGDQRLAVSAREAELTQARLELAELQAGTRVEEQARLGGELKIAEAEETLAQLELERGKTLVTQEVISASDLNVLEARVQAAQGKRLAAVAELDQARTGTRAETLAVSAARVDRAQTNLVIAQRELAKTNLYAPWDGVVGARFVSPGAVLGAGSPVFELVDADHLEVELQVPSHEALRLSAGAQALLWCDEDPEFRVKAAVDAKLPAADEPSRTFVALIRLGAQPGSDGRAVTSVFKPGMFVRAEIQLEPVRGKLVVPPDSIRQTERGPIVVCAKPAPAGDGGAQTPGLVAAWVPVRLLGADADGQAVEALDRAQLTASDRVVVTGVDLAFPGVPLQPRPDPTAEDARAAPPGPGEESQ